MFAHQYHLVGCSLIVFDFRGYGWSTGEPNFTVVLSDAEAAMNSLSKILSWAGIRDDAPLVLYGRSMGSGAAVHAAKMGNPRVKALVLDSAIADISKLPMVRMLADQVPVAKQLINSGMLGCPFSNASKLRSIPLPLLVVHGKKDQISPHDQGAQLHRSSSAPSERKRIMLFSDSGHNDTFLRHGEEILGAVSDVLALAAGAAGAGAPLLTRAAAVASTSRGSDGAAAGGASAGDAKDTESSKADLKVRCESDFPLVAAASSLGWTPPEVVYGSSRPSRSPAASVSSGSRAGDARRGAGAGSEVATDDSEVATGSSSSGTTARSRAGSRDGTRSGRKAGTKTEDGSRTADANEYGASAARLGVGGGAGAGAAASGDGAGAGAAGSVADAPGAEGGAVASEGGSGGKSGGVVAGDGGAVVKEVSGHRVAHVGHDEEVSGGRAGASWLCSADSCVVA